MKITLGQTEVSLLNPPNDGQVIDGLGGQWLIRRSGNGNIVLRQPSSAPLGGSICHEEFANGGMDLHTFCQWINSHL